MADKFQFGDVPKLPVPRAGGGIASDLAGGFSSFVKSMQESREREAERAFREATLRLQERGLTQREAEAEAEREFRRELLEREATLRERLELMMEQLRKERELAVERERRQRLSGLTPASRTAQMGRIRAEFDQQLRAREEARRREIEQRSMQPGAGSLLGERELAVLEGRSKPELLRADTLAALEAVRRQVPETPELVSEFERSILGGGGEPAGVSASDEDVQDVIDAFRAGMTPATLIQNARRSGASPQELQRLIQAIEAAGRAVRGGS